MSITAVPMILLTLRSSCLDGDIKHSFFCLMKGGWQLASARLSPLLFSPPLIFFLLLSVHSTLIISRDNKSICSNGFCLSILMSNQNIVCHVAMFNCCGYAQVFEVPLRVKKKKLREWGTNMDGPICRIQSSCTTVSHIQGKIWQIFSNRHYKSRHLVSNVPWA